MIASHFPHALPRTASMSDMIVGRLSARSIVHANVSSLQIATAVLVIFIVVAGLPFALGYLWFLYRRRLQRRERDAPGESIGLMALDSTLPVGLGIQDSSCSEQAVAADGENGLSASTVLSAKSPELTLLTPSHWPTKSTPGPKGRILDRRGKTQLQCDTTAQYAIDAVLTGSMMPRSCPANHLQLLPVYGFDEATITPPIGSPLWRRKPDSAGIPESPKLIMRSKLSSRGLVTFSDFIDRPRARASDVYDSAVTVEVTSPHSPSEQSSGHPTDKGGA